MNHKEVITILSQLLYEKFATDQNAYAIQQEDGTYRKNIGSINPFLINSIINQNGSLALYQKNRDQSVNWLCFDFDILKRHLTGDLYDSAKKELVEQVNSFINYLEIVEIPYLLEFSGNRGYHVWIFFSEKVEYSTAFSILESILSKSEIKYDTSLIDIDKFPARSYPSGGSGKAVKIPLSKHKKSNNYSILTKDCSEMEISSFSKDILNSQVKLLRECRQISKSEIEKKLQECFIPSHFEHEDIFRVKEISIKAPGFTLDQLLNHWELIEPLNSLVKLISKKDGLQHKHRLLLVGLLNNIRLKSNKTFSLDLIHEIFSTQQNYNKDITNKAIESLRSYNYPCIDQIENTLKSKFKVEIENVSDLIKHCIPSVHDVKEASLDMSLHDIEVTTAAEVKYLVSNDEVKIKSIFTTLNNDNKTKIFSSINYLMQNPDKIRYYSHIRNEGNKKRTLISLDGYSRVVSSVIIKQLVYFLDIKPNSNSYGYRINKGFINGHIFEPWLPSWRTFINNIEQVISNDLNKDQIIVKADIKSFYSTIPHDNLKRQLLGDDYTKINYRIENLADYEIKKYKSYIDFLFKITELITGNTKGLPQGPAYARFLAELYLDKLDDFFLKKIDIGEVSFYQRYVDDIFFVTSNTTNALLIYDEISEFLSKMSLKLNTDKKNIKRVSDFRSDFDSYRSLSKYIVDKMSHNFFNGTDTQRNLAINEYLKIVQSDQYEGDLSFIFSHLRDVEIADNAKKELVVPTLQKGIGRGSVYKHLFSFVLADKELWLLLDNVKNFTELQSEVLLSEMINDFDNKKQEVENLKYLLENIFSKLKITDLVQEDLAYLLLNHNVNIDYRKIDRNILLDTISKLNNGNKLILTNELVDYLNVEINEVKDFCKFIDILFPLASSNFSCSSTINKLASIYFAKIAIEFSTLDSSLNVEPLVDNYIQANKFLYLISLFSLSESNDSIDLLNNTWKYCISIFNAFDGLQSLNNLPCWEINIPMIEISRNKLEYVITSIIELVPFRGLRDKLKVFEKYHSRLLLYVAFGKTGINMSVQDALSKLKTEGLFYEWLSEPENVTTFPESSKKWFEQNIMHNSTIILQKDDMLLFRKPKEFFYNQKKIIKSNNGYADYIVKYEPNDFKSIKSFIDNKNIQEILKTILLLLEETVEKELYPNIFFTERIIDKNRKLISSEFSTSNKFLIEVTSDLVEVESCSRRNFIISFFKFIDNHVDSGSIKHIYRDYINHLDHEIDIKELLVNILSNIQHTGDINFEFNRDIVISTAIYNTIHEKDVNKRITLFLKIYNKIHDDYLKRHIYCVDQTEPRDNNPKEFLQALVNSISTIEKKYNDKIRFDLLNDILSIKKSLSKLVGNFCEISQIDNFLLDFKKCVISVQHISKSLSVDGVKYPFEEAILYNYLDECHTIFEPIHSTFINQSEHTYYCEVDEKIHIIAFQPNLSIMFDSIHRRYTNIISVNKNSFSYPFSIKEIENIKKLGFFDKAKKVISMHKYIEDDEAESLLLNWLKWFPQEFHEPLISLISGHVVMRNDKLLDYTSQLNTIRLKNRSNLILMKRPGDFSGVYRIISHFDPELSRFLEQMSPNNFDNSKQETTIIVDNILSGNSIRSALNYYFGKGKDKKETGCFMLSKEERESFKRSFEYSSKINLFTMFYTEKGINLIERFLKNTFNKNISINVIYGENISNNAFFETTELINESKKESIRKLFNDIKKIGVLKDCFKHNDGKNDTELIPENIESLNMITRFKSLPKKCFKILCTELNHENKLKLFDRVREIPEITSDNYRSVDQFQ